jgi:hypothetical protein
MGERPKSVEIVPLEGRVFPNNFILTHGELARQEDKDAEVGNWEGFQIDIKKGRLAKYLGSWVAYQQGVLCGQSSDGRLLFKSASHYYGASSLGVFKVPLIGEEADTKMAFGHK